MFYVTFTDTIFSGVGKGGLSSRQNVICIGLTCTKFANLVSIFLGKIIKIVATRYHLLQLTANPDPSLDFRRS